MNRIKTYPKWTIVVLLVTCFTLFGFPHSALASNNIPPGVKILLGFKERYGEDKKQHLGIDVYAPQGTELRSPVNGTISFVGRVPGSAGLNVSAVTVTTEGGDQVSLNPFESTVVNRGDNIIKGQTLGTVSDVGDPSSPESHYHLSLRVKGSYRDPTHLLSAGIAAVEKDKLPSPVPVIGTANPSSTNNTKANSPVESAVKESASQTSGEKAKASSQSRSASEAAGTKLGAAAPQSNKGALPVAKKESPAPATHGVQTSQQSLKAQEVKLSAGAELSRETQSQPGLNAFSQEKLAASTSSIGSKANNAINTKVNTDFSLNKAAFLQAGAEPFVGGGNSEAEGIGLRAEVYGLVSKMSQAQIAASLAVVTVLLSCSGLGVWRTAQLVGVQSAFIGVRDRFQEAARQRFAKGGEVI